MPNIQLSPAQAEVVKQAVRWVTVVLFSTRDEHVLTLRCIEHQVIAFDPVVD